jgi:hypothetical protein
MSKTKISKLKAMAGKTWRHTDETVYKFLSINVDEDQCFIATDKEWLKPTVYNLDVFFEQYTEVEQVGNQVMIVEKNPLPQRRVESSIMPGSTMESLRDTLLDNIEKVKKDKDFIPQAQQISNSVNTIIGLAKIEIDLRSKI